MINDLIEVSAKQLMNFSSTLDVNWDCVYFRLCVPSSDHHQFQWSYKSGRTVDLCRISPDVRQAYFTPVKNSLIKVFDELENGKGRPVVAVLEVARDQEYKVHFDYSGQDALQINKLSLGLDNSFFNAADIDISQSVLDFQAELKISGK